MLETIGNLLGNVAVYVTALLGLIALYFFGIALREWRTGQRAVFGIERDIASSEMVGALARAGGIVVVGLFIFVLGQLGRQAGPSEDTAGRATQPSIATLSIFGTTTPELGSPVPLAVPTDTPSLDLTDVPALPTEPSQLPVVEPTPQTARVTAPGGLWLRDAPNGGTIDVLPQESIVQFVEGREFAGSFEWQKVRVLNTPPGGEALVGQEGWVALEFLETSP